MKLILTFATLLLATITFGQFTQNPFKQKLGYTTTAHNLILLTNGVPIHTPSSIYDTYVALDTANSILYKYNLVAASWEAVGSGVSGGGIFEIANDGNTIPTDMDVLLGSNILTFGQGSATTGMFMNPVTGEVRIDAGNSLQQTYSRIDPDEIELTVAPDLFSGHFAKLLIDVRDNDAPLLSLNLFTAVPQSNIVLDTTGIKFNGKDGLDNPYSYLFPRTTPVTGDVMQYDGSRFVNIPIDDALTGVNYGDILYVSTTGNNATAEKGNPNKTWSDIETAIGAAVSGDVVHVFAGDYSPASNLWKDGVKLWFDDGTRIISVGTTLFNASLAESMSVKGHVEIDSTYTGDLTSFNHPDIDFYFEGKKAYLKSLTIGSITQVNRFVMDFEELYTNMQAGGAQVATLVNADSAYIVIKADNHIYKANGDHHFMRISETKGTRVVMDFKNVDAECVCKDSGILLENSGNSSVHDSTYVSIKLGVGKFYRPQGVAPCPSSGIIGATGFGVDYNIDLDCRECYLDGHSILRNSLFGSIDMRITITGNYVVENAIGIEQWNFRNPSGAYEPYVKFDGNMFVRDMQAVNIEASSGQDLILSGRIHTPTSNPVVNIGGSFGGTLRLKDVALINDGTVAALQSGSAETVVVEGAFQTVSSLEDPDITISRSFEYGVIEDSTRIIQDSIVVYYQNGMEVGRDTILTSSGGSTNVLDTILVVAQSGRDTLTKSDSSILIQGRNDISAYILGGTLNLIDDKPKWQPMGYGDSEGIADLNYGPLVRITNDTFRNEFPGVAWNPITNRIVICYRQADVTHFYEAGTRIKGRYSDDFGKTWSADYTIDSIGGTTDIRDTEITWDPKLEVFMVMYTAVTSSDLSDGDIRLAISKDGINFTPYATIPPPSTFCLGRSVDRPRRLANGNLAIPIYTKFQDDCGTATDTTRVWMGISEDDGITWDYHLIITSPQPQDYSEAELVVKPDGTVVVFVRRNAGNGLVRFESTDHGVTWDAGTTITPPDYRPDKPSYVMYDDSVMLFTYRQLTDVEGQKKYVLTTDYGDTWQNNDTIQGINEFVMYDSHAKLYGTASMYVYCETKGVPPSDSMPDVFARLIYRGSGHVGEFDLSNPKRFEKSTATTDTLTFDLDYRTRRVIQQDITGTGLKIVNATNPFVGGEYKFHFLNDTKGDTIYVEFPTNFFKYNGDAMTGGYGEGFAADCYYDQDDRYYCDVSTKADPLFTPTGLSPDSLTGLVFWANASKETEFSDGGAVDTIKDWSGNNHHFLVTNTITFETNSAYTGDSTFIFSGPGYAESIDALTTWNFLHQDSSTVLVFFKPGSVADPDSSMTLLDNSSVTSANIGYWLPWEDRETAQGWSNTFQHSVNRGVGSTWNVLHRSDNDGLLPSQFNFFAVATDPENVTAAIRSSVYPNRYNNPVQNNIQTSALSASDASFNLIIGAVNDRISKPQWDFSGEISEVIIYDRILTDTELRDLYFYYVTNH